MTTRRYRPVEQKPYTSKAGVEVRVAVYPRRKPTLDEVVASGLPFHLEYMSNGHVWMQVGDVHVNLWSEKPIYGRAEVM